MATNLRSRNPEYTLTRYCAEKGEFGLQVTRKFEGVTLTPVMLHLHMDTVKVGLHMEPDRIGKWADTLGLSNIGKFDLVLDLMEFTNTRGEGMEDREDG